MTSADDSDEGRLYRHRLHCDLCRCLRQHLERRRAAETAAAVAP